MPNSMAMCRVPKNWATSPEVSGTVDSHSRPMAAEKISTLAALIGSSTKRAMTRSEEHTSELQSLMRISYAVFCLKKKKQRKNTEKRQVTCTYTRIIKTRTKNV